MDGHGRAEAPDRLATPERQAEIDVVLERFFSVARARAAALGAPYALLWDELHASSRGGKRFRPLLVVGAYEALGGDDRAAAANVGAAFELLHTALIVHDDVIDRDFVRRGGPNVAGAYRDRALAGGADAAAAEHRGISAAVIAGDLALTGAYRMIERSGVHDETRSRLVELMDDAVFASAAGELLDVELAGSAGMPAVDDILSMERLKTAVYSFEGPLQAAAILAGAGEETICALGDIGRDLGIAYQIVDDVLGVFGGEETGKTTLGDLREGKRTVLLSFATASEAFDAVRHLVGSPDLDAERAERIREVLVTTGARDFAEGLARYYANRALGRTVEPFLPGELREMLRPLAEAVLRRAR